jgi:hypothetical protein
MKCGPLNVDLKQNLALIIPFWGGIYTNVFFIIEKNSKPNF